MSIHVNIYIEQVKGGRKGFGGRPLAGPTAASVQAVSQERRLSENKERPDGPRRNERHTGPLKGINTIFDSDLGARRLELTEDHIQSVLLVRRARASVLGEHLFSDPAWDILLELYAASLAGRSVTLSELARVTETPVSIATRWVQALEQSGNVSVDRDPEGSPFLVYVKLSAEGVSRMQRLADHWGSAFVSIA